MWLCCADDINRKIWLQVSDDAVKVPFGPDVAARHDIPRLLRIGWGIDVDWETAKRWNLHMPTVTIWETPPAGLIINSTAAWRPSLAETARQFNELSPWAPLPTAPKSVAPVAKSNARGSRSCCESGTRSGRACRKSGAGCRNETR